MSFRCFSAGAARRDEWPFTCNGSIEKVTLSGNIRSNDNLLLCRAAVAGFGLTIQPSFNVWRELRSGQLETVLDGWQVDELGGKPSDQLHHIQDGLLRFVLSQARCPDRDSCGSGCKKVEEYPDFGRQKLPVWEDHEHS
jgi:DNA-binding transcriptional LysR family regulator